MPCRTQLHHARLHDFSAKRARIQEAPGAEPPDLYLPFGSANQSAVVFFFVCIQDQECSDKNIYRKRGARVQR